MIPIKRHEARIFLSTILKKISSRESFIVKEMSTLVGYTADTFTFHRQGKDWIVSRDLVYYLFYVHGYPVDPLDPNCQRLQDFTMLYDSARENNDTEMLVLLEKEINLHLTSSSQASEEEQQAMELLLKLGFYLGGWNGPSEPYPTHLKPPHDTIVTEMRVEEILQQLESNENFVELKGYQAISYSHTLNKKQLYPHKLNITIDDIIQQISTTDNHEMAQRLIHTCYYYLNHLYGVSYDVIETLISSSTLPLLP